jgi:hypothetical protein
MENEKDNDKKKTVAESVGDKPVNSRIYIDYEKTPPEIKFEYPDDSINQVRNSSLTYLLAMVIAGIIVVGLVIYWMYLLDNSIFPNSNEAHINYARINEYQNLSNYTNLYVEYTWMNQSQNTVIRFERMGQFWYYPTFYDIRNVQNSIWKDLIPALVIYGLFFLLTFIFARLIALMFYKTKWGHKAFPDLNKRLHDKKYSAEFFPLDFPTDGKNIIELPMFQNMYMDYEASGEFSKYLVKISIIEHPFSKYVKKKGKAMEKSRGQLRKEEKLARKKQQGFDSSRYDPFYNKKKNIYLWKAIFEFKEVPKTGSLRIWFT